MNADTDLLEFARQYFSLIHGEFAGLNLTRIDTFESFYPLQVLDSVRPLETCEEFQKSLTSSQVILDIGFGGGVPILPLAKKLNTKKFIGIEARNKKVLAVKTMANKLKLKNVHLVHSRLEDLMIDTPTTILLKAVGNMEKFLSLIYGQLHKTEVTVYFYKGPRVNELERTKEILQKPSMKNWKLITEHFYELDNVEGRYLMGFVLSETGKENVLRGTNCLLDLKKKKLSNSNKERFWLSNLEKCVKL